MKILHLTAHLGGGVGKVLSEVIAQSCVSGLGISHLIVCLEKPEKMQFVDQIVALGAEVVICPSQNRLESLIQKSDIIQLEWWNHPATIQCLCRLAKSPMRLLTWSHVAGLQTPIIPQALILASHRFLFTSACSLEAKAISQLIPALGDRLAVVSSSGGFAALPEVYPQADDEMTFAYIGSLNFSKLHPRYVDYLAAVKIPGFRVRMIGDLNNQEILNQQCKRLGLEDLLEFRGYTTNIASELASINVLVYLLNPEHYGTTENALLEAMAMGIVPIVLDNPAERQIVEDHKTGLIIHSPDEFAEAVQWLSDYPLARQKMGRQAALSVRERFTGEKMSAALHTHYQAVVSMNKKEIGFSEIFGDDPAAWFLSCQKDRSIFAADGNINLNNVSPFNDTLFEEKKGSVFHFSAYFQENSKLKLWAKHLKSIPPYYEERSNKC